MTVRNRLPRSAGLVLAALILLIAPAQAQEQPREDEIFSAEEEEEEAPADPAVLDRFDAAADEREGALFGSEYEDGRLGDRELELLHRDRLQVGGMLYLRYALSGYEGHRLEPGATMPNLLDLYVDGRPNDRVRGFVKGRLRFDPVTATNFPGMPAATARAWQEWLQALAENPAMPEEARAQFESRLQPPDQVRALLDQLWLKFDIARTLYLTLGKQPLHWGTARLWNPVDVVNSTRREPLALMDERSGVTALKLHLPIESLAWNVIGVVLLEGADQLSEIGGALRLEAAFNLLEVGLTGMVRAEEQPDGEELVIPKLGLDLSAAVWELDFTGEAALSLPATSRFDQPQLGDRPLVLQAAAGLSYTHKYSAEDFFIVGGEFFHNPDGYQGKEDYAAAFATPGAFTPFYLGRYYGALYFALPSPGSFDYTSFTLSTIANLSDLSFLSRFDYSVTVLTYLFVQAYLAVNYGEPGGEFRFGLEPDAVFPGAPGLPQQSYSAGLNLRIDL